MVNNEPITIQEKRSLTDLSSLHIFFIIQYYIIGISFYIYCIVQYNKTNKLWAYT